MSRATTIASALAVLCASLLLTSCGREHKRREEARLNPIVSTWSLVRVDSKSPSRINVKEWRITFRENGTWSYAGSMEGSLAGMKLSGAGTWRVVSPGHLEYRAGDIRGTLAFALNGNSLSFRPDPVLAKPGGVGEVVTDYERVDSRNSSAP